MLRYSIIFLILLFIAYASFATDNEEDLNITELKDFTPKHHRKMTKDYKFWSSEKGIENEETKDNHSKDEIPERSFETYKSNLMCYSSLSIKTKESGEKPRKEDSFYKIKTTRSTYSPDRQDTAQS